MPSAVAISVFFLVLSPVPRAALLWLLFVCYRGPSSPDDGVILRGSQCVDATSRGCCLLVLDKGAVASPVA